MSRAAADAWFEQRQDAFEGKLEARFNALGQIRWPQVLLTHTDGNIPADGVGTLPDSLNTNTSDNDDGWGKLNFSIGGLWQAALRVDNYGISSVQRHLSYQGYVILSFVREGGVLYQKARNNGPEIHREQDWVEAP